jgi:predicted DCC family thiol-disulfide oxidoreductase YuxK
VTEPDVLFYDGGCAVCHRTVRFVLRADRAERFVFAPLQGSTFRQLLPESVRKSLPDSLVLRSPDGRLFVRSSAVLHILSRLGGIWAVLGGLARLVPRPLRDAVYDFIARIRLRLFDKPDDFCPLVPKELRARFLP